MHITTVIELEEDLVAEEIEPGLWAIRRKSPVTHEITTVYMTSNNIQYLSRKVHRNGK